MKTRQVGMVLWIAILLFMVASSLYAQKASTLVQSKVEIFTGAELHYRDLFYGKIYEVLVNFTPGVKWNMGRQWMLAGQAIIPVYNDYGRPIQEGEAEHGGSFQGMGLEQKAVLEDEWRSVRYGALWLGCEVDVSREPLVSTGCASGTDGLLLYGCGWECSKMTRVSGWLV